MNSLITVMRQGYQTISTRNISIGITFFLSFSFFLMVTQFLITWQLVILQLHNRKGRQFLLKFTTNTTNNACNNLQQLWKILSIFQYSATFHYYLSNFNENKDKKNKCKTEIYINLTSSFSISLDVSLYAVFKVC